MPSGDAQRVVLQLWKRARGYVGASAVTVALLSKWVDIPLRVLALLCLPLGLVIAVRVYVATRKRSLTPVLRFPLASHDRDRRFVFCYGSLLDVASALRTVPERDVFHCMPGTVRGYVLGWGAPKTRRVAGSEAGSVLWWHAVVARRVEDGAFEKLRATDRPAGLEGAIVAFSSFELRQLLGRERNYRLIDVSREFVPKDAGAEVPRRVWMFVPRPESEERTRRVQRRAVDPTYVRSVNVGRRTCGFRRCVVPKGFTRAPFPNPDEEFVRFLRSWRGRKLLSHLGKAADRVTEEGYAMHSEVGRRPIVVPARAQMRLKRSAEWLVSALARTAEAMARDPHLRGELEGLVEATMWKALVRSGPGDWRRRIPDFCRIDFAWLGGFPRALEVNADSPAWFLLSDRLSSSFARVLRAHGRDGQWEAQTSRCVEGVVDRLSALADGGGRTAIIDDYVERWPTSVEMRVIRDLLKERLGVGRVALESIGGKKIIATPQGLVIEGSTVPYRVIYKRILLRSLAKEPDNVDAILDACAKGTIRCVNDPASWPVNNRVLLALISDKRWPGWVAGVERDGRDLHLRKRVVPESYIWAPGWVSEEKREEICDDAGGWVLKPAWATEGRGIEFGCRHSLAWEEMASRFSQNQPPVGILQRFCPHSRGLVPEESGCWAWHYLVYQAFLFRGRCHSLEVRTSGGFPVTAGEGKPMFRTTVASAPSF